MGNLSRPVNNLASEQMFYVWYDEGCCDDCTDNLDEAFQWARELRKDGWSDVYVTDQDNLVQVSRCWCCEQNGVSNLAFCTAAQSSNQGTTINYGDICAVHAREWNKDSDWIAPLYPILSLIPDDQEPSEGRRSEHEARVLHANRRYRWSSGTGRIVLELDGSDVCATTSSTDKIRVLRHKPYIAEQLARIDRQLLREELEAYYRGSVESLPNPEENLLIVLWLAGLYIIEHDRINVY